MKYFKVLLSAILGGVCIGLGGTVYLSSDYRIIGAILFAVGLFVICAFGLNLFTGQISHVLQRDKEYAIDMPIVLAGNLFGAWIMALLVRAGGMSEVISRAQTLVDSKMTESLINMFFLAILCNIMIYIAVEGFRNASNDVAKIVSVFIGVIVFVMCGFEHSIADMFYFSLSGLTVSMIIPLLIIILGNAVGGIVTHNLYAIVGTIAANKDNTNNIEDMFKNMSMGNEEAPEEFVQEPSYGYEEQLCTKE